MPLVLLAADTLTNVPTPEESTSSSQQNAQLVAAIHENGESVENARSAKKQDPTEIFPHDPDKQWFVMRATLGRLQKAKQQLDELGLQTYLPMIEMVKEVNGRPKRMIVPVVSNILFVYCSPQAASEVVANKQQLSYISYYYNHFATQGNNNPPLTVRYQDMINFIRVAEAPSNNKKIVRPEQVHFKNGDYVEITDGVFKGVRGRLARVLGQQRVVVDNGVCTLATAYIPTAFVKVIEA